LIVKSTRKGEILLDAIFVRLVNGGRAAEIAAALGVFGLRQMAFARAGAQNFSAGGDFEPLNHGLLRFNAFGTSHNSNSSLQKERAIYVA
jgi:hypothetical protein